MAALRGHDGKGEVREGFCVKVRAYSGDPIARGVVEVFTEM
jgi:hypothetical protein